MIITELLSNLFLYYKKSYTLDKNVYHSDNSSIKIVTHSEIAKKAILLVVRLGPVLAIAQKKTNLNSL